MQFRSHDRGKKKTPRHLTGSLDVPDHALSTSSFFRSRDVHLAGCCGALGVVDLAQQDDGVAPRRPGSGRRRRRSRPRREAASAFPRSPRGPVRELVEGPHDAHELRPSRRMTRTRLSSWSTSDAAAGSTKPAMRSHRLPGGRGAARPAGTALSLNTIRRCGAHAGPPKNSRELPKNPFW